MKDRGTKKVNVQLSEPEGAFVGTEHPGPDPTGVPRWSKGKKRVSGENFHANGDSAATSVKAARTPTHWRRGGFVTRN